MSLTSQWAILIKFVEWKNASVSDSFFIFLLRIQNEAFSLNLSLSIRNFPIFPIIKWTLFNLSESTLVRWLLPSTSNLIFVKDRTFHSSFLSFALRHEGEIIAIFSSEDASTGKLNQTFSDRKLCFYEKNIYWDVWTLFMKSKVMKLRRQFFRNVFTSKLFQKRSSSSLKACLRLGKLRAFWLAGRRNSFY